MGISKKFKVGDKAIMIAYPTDSEGYPYEDEVCCIGKVVTIVSVLSLECNGFEYDIGRVKSSGRKCGHSCMGIQLAPMGELSSALYTD